MAIINNTSSEIGDVMFMVTNIPITGIVSINNFTDITIGENAGKFFKKEFRYSLDGGLNFNIEGYQLLSPSILNVIPIDPSYDIIFEYRYTRVGIDNTGVLEWSSTNLITVNQPIVCGPAFSNSIFSFFFNTCYHPQVINWSLNVLSKLYNPGILPLSMTRNENQNINQEDRDFIDFWRSITNYYALLVGYARGFENFNKNKGLLLEFLRQRGVFLCENQTLLDLRYIQKNYWDEMRHRGTLLISKPKDSLINGNIKPVDGELLRLICFNKDCDEFLFDISEFNTIGWVINNWSPLWQGLSTHKQLIKIYEKSDTIEDLTKYPIHNSGFVGTITIPSIGGDVMIIKNVPTGATAGVGILNGVFDPIYSTNIDPNIPYEISFMVRASSLGGVIPKLTLKLFGYNQNGANLSFQEMDNFLLADNQILLDQIELIDNQWIKISAILYPISKTFVNNPDQKFTNLGIGRNLKIKSLSTCKLIPQIFLDNTNGLAISGSIELYRIRLTPASTNYSTGFINTSNFIQTWTKNNQKSLTESDVKQIMKSYLLPYKSTLQNNFL